MQPSDLCIMQTQRAAWHAGQLFPPGKRCACPGILGHHYKIPSRPLCLPQFCLASSVSCLQHVHMQGIMSAAQVEYASAGRLADRCCDGQRLAEPQARALFAQLLGGLAYCHGKGVCHRDLRTELLLLSGRHARTS